MNKKIESEIAIGILVVVAVAIGFVFVKKAQAPVVQPTAMQQPAPQALPATQITPVTTQPVQTNETANLKTFTSSANKVSFNYASSDTVGENKNTITITGITGTAAANGTDDTISLVINVFNNPTKKGLQDWFKSTFNTAANKDCAASNNDSGWTIGTYQSMLFDAGIDQACDARGYYAISQDNTMVAKFSLGQDPLADADKILSTLKFIN